MNKKLKPWLLLSPLLLILLFFLVGIVNGVLQSFGIIPALGLTEFTFAYYGEILSDPTLLSSIGLSLYIATASSVLAVALGVVLAWCIVTVFQAKGWVYNLSKTPILVPHTVVALLIINMLAPTGLLARIFVALGWEGGAELLSEILFFPNSFGIILAYIWKETPFICYFVIGTMAGVSNRLGDAAANLGAGRWRSFWHVTLPHCAGPIKNGFIITFVYAFGAYELPLLLGATLPKALPVQAYVEYVHPDLLHRPYAMALNTIMLVLALVAAALFFHLVRVQRRRKEARP